MTKKRKFASKYMTNSIKSLTLKQLKDRAKNYFKKMLAAKRKGAKSFTHNGNTYVAKKAKTGITIYKKK